MRGGWRWKGKLFFYSFLVGLLVGLVSPSFLPGLRDQAAALEKIKLGTATKVGLTAYLPVLTAEQRGFWKENGLEAEWVPFEGAAPLTRAAAAGALNIGLSGSDAPMSAAEKGLPVIMVAEYVSEYPYYIFVRSNSPYRHARDLKGAKIGVTTLGGSTHAYARVIAKAHDIEKDVRFVGAGGVPSAIAGFRAGAFEAILQPLSVLVGLKLEGTAREIASTADYLPKPWVHYTIFVRKDYARSKADVVRKVIRATLHATDFVRKNPRWTMDLMKRQERYSEEAAELIYKEPHFNVTGKIDRQGVENVRRFLIEYGIISEKAPTTDEFFTNEYLPG